VDLRGSGHRIECTDFRGRLAVSLLEEQLFPFEDLFIVDIFLLERK
jgi:hypothetical protein